MIAALLMAITITLPPIEPPIEPCEVYQAEQRYSFIEENHLEYVYMSCYLPTGYKTADGTVPYEGVVSSNKEHLGMDCIVYDKDLTPVMRLECRDIGGDPRLVNGTAIDVFRDSYERAIQLREEYSDHVYVRWIPREEGKDEESVSGNSVE